MALIVEDGTGLTDADSFASTEEADTRNAALGFTNWATLTDDEKDQALRRATQYMEQAYSRRWSGTRNTLEQALSWPRSDVVVEDFDIDSDVVPTTIKNACIDLALRAAAGDLNPDLTRKVIRQKLGPLEKEFDRNSPEAKRYRAITMALTLYFAVSSGRTYR